MKDKVLDILVNISGVEEVKDDLDLDLFENGILDSLGVIELLLAIEDEFSVKIEPTEVERDEISTPNKIIEYLSKKVNE